jgi:hypothetical protein
MIWKEIKGYENLYWINKLGEIKTKKGTILTPQKNQNGYYRIGLTKNKQTKRCYLHVLLAKTFIPNPENKPQVHHKDNDGYNNSLENLEWVTNSENQIYAEKKNNYLISVVNLETKEQTLFKALTKASRFLGKRKEYLFNKKKDKGNKFQVENNKIYFQVNIQEIIKKK